MHDASLSPPSGGHESSLFSITRIAWFAAALIILIGLTGVIAVFLEGGFRLPNSVTLEALKERNLARATVPQLQSAPADDLQTYRHAKQALLEKYQWIDKTHGRVQIPIEQAMRLIAERRAPPARPSDSRQAAP